MKRRPTWALRSFLLTTGVPWPEVRAMTPPELLARAREIHGERKGAA